jgi:hypothetical protein
MKKLFLLSIAATLTCNYSFAKIWRVNNNVGVAANFTTAQAANDAATVSAGDTIHLEPSTTSYGNLNCTKRLVWISTGTFLNIHPNEQFSPNTGMIDALQATQLGCENSVFHVYVNFAVNIGVQGIRLDRTFAGSTISVDNYGNPVTNTVIINCYSRGDLYINVGNNNVITNNIFEGTLNVYPGTAQAVITHNVFNAVSATAGTVNNSSLTNNLFNKANSAYTFINCTVQYNMSGGTGVLPAGNNNQNGIDMNTVFADNNGNTDAAFVLKAGSPAIGAGSGTPAANLGAYGGSSPFKLAMQPAIPAIYKIEAPAAPSGNTMNVTFSTKSNN